MSSQLLIFALFFMAVVQTYGNGRDGEERLQFWLRQPASRGSVFAQGRMDGVDYRKLLRGAIAYDNDSLADMFRYTANGRMIGEGAETNCEILHLLLEHWGDSHFAAILARQPTRVRETVIREIESAWSDAGWQPSEFPKTYQLASHERTSRSRR